MVSGYSVRAPFVGEEGVRDPVPPGAVPVQGLAHRVLLPPHPDLLHDVPRGAVLDEAPGFDPAHPETVERDGEQLADEPGYLPESDR